MCNYLRKQTENLQNAFVFVQFQKNNSNEDFAVESLEE